MSCSGIPLIEPYAIPDDYVSGIAVIEPLGSSCCRFVMYVDHTPESGAAERIVVRKLVIAYADLPKATRKVLRHLADKGIEIGRKEISRMFS